MDHIEIQNKLEAFYDKEVTSIESREIAAHLEQCLGCLEVLRELEMAGSLLRQTAQSEQLSPVFTFRVMEAIESKEKFDPASFIKWLIPSLVIPALALFFIGTLPLTAEETFSVQNVLRSENPFSAAEAMTMQSNADWMGLENL